MKKLFKSALSLTLALLLCVSLMTPAVFAAKDNADLAPVGDDPFVLNKHAVNTTVTKADLQNICGNTSGAYYGFAPADNPTSITYVKSDASISAGSYVALKTTASTGNILNKKPDWTKAEEPVPFTVRTFYNGTLSVIGCRNGSLLLDGEPVSDFVSLYTDSSYVITAADVADYSCRVEGVTAGQAFTPTADMEITAYYLADSRADFTVNATEGGTVKVYADGDLAVEGIPAGQSFTVEATPNTDGGYKLDSVVVTKGETTLEGPEYGPVANGESYTITVNFVFDPAVVEYALHADSKLTNSVINNLFGGSSSDTRNYSFGFAAADTPNDITKATSGGSTVAAGDYIIYKVKDTSSNPDWTKSKVLKLTLTTYYNASFSVSGNAEGEVYLNGEAVTGTVKLTPGESYTITAKAIPEYYYTMTGAEDGVAFNAAADVTVSVKYMKEAFATFTVTEPVNGTITVLSNGEVMTDRIGEGETFTVETAPDKNRGYKLDSVTVTKDGAEVAPVEGTQFEFGPVVKDEAYVISANFVFDPDTVTYELHAGSKLTSTILTGLFGDSVLNLFTNSYGFVKADSTDAITEANTSGHLLEAGTYYIYRSGSNPNWETARVLKLELKTYYNASFAVTGHEEGAVYLNGEAVSGSMKLYEAGPYTVTTKEIEDYTCTLYGAEEGVEFTLTEDLDVTAAYMKDAHATVAVNPCEGGTIEILSNGEATFGKVAEGNTFVVNAAADADHNYYLESVTVTKNGEEVAPVEGTQFEFGPVVDLEQYEVTATFAKASLTLDDCDVIYMDIVHQDFDAIKASILAATTLTPEEFEESASYEVEYVAYTLLGYDIYAPLNYTGDLAHPFGNTDNNNTLKDGNTERIRVTCTLAKYGIEMRATAVATVKDTREPVRVEAGSAEITYGDDLKAALIDSIVVYNSSDEPIEFTESDIAVVPAYPNATAEPEEQEVTVRYKGSEVYAIGEGTATVIVNRAESSIDAKNEVITYGETPALEVTTTPAKLSYLTVIAGIDGDAKGVVCIDFPDSMKEAMKISLAGVIDIDLYSALSSYIGEGTTIAGLKEAIANLNETIASSDVIADALEDRGISMETLNTVVKFIEALPDLGDNVIIRLGKAPNNAGVYLIGVFSADSNYYYSADTAYLVIKQASSTEEENIELRFNSEIEDEQNVLTYDEAQEFEFGGALYVNDELTESKNLRTLYTGTTLTGDVIAQAEPIRMPGVYTETVFLLGGNYAAAPITRTFFINRTETMLSMDDMTVTYDGEAHALEAAFVSGIEEADITYTYVGSGYYSHKAPTDAGVYKVHALYSGDETHMACSATATLTIEKLDATITVTCKEEVTYGDLSLLDISAADVQYTVSGTINNDKLGVIVPSVEIDKVIPTVGEYTATVLFYQSNDNYNVTIENAVLKIVPRAATITVDNTAKAFGKADPKFTYKTDISPLLEDINVTLTREEGESIGTYAINAEVEENPNYTFTVVPGTLTIAPKIVIVTIRDAKKTYGEEDPELNYTVVDDRGRAYDASAIGLTVAREEGDDVGRYAIKATYNDDADYTVLVNEGVFTINPKTVKISIDNQMKFYGDDDPTLTYFVSDGKGNTVKGSEIGLNIAREEGEKVGRYTINATYNDDPNYNVTVNKGTLIILPKVVTVSIDDAEKVYGEEDPELTYTVTDAQGNPYDAEKIGLTVAREEGDNAGQYAIKATYNDDTNYIVIVKNGTFTIKKIVVNVDIDDAEKTYGEEDPAFTYTVTDAQGESFDASVIELNVARHEGEDAGVYFIDASYNGDPNYAVYVNLGFFTIHKKVVNVVIDDAEKTYGDADPELTFTATDADENPFDASVLRMSAVRAFGERVGEYTIYASYRLNPNYDVNVTRGTFTINPKTVNIVIDNIEKPYGADDPELTYTATDAEGNPVDVSALRVKLTREEGEYIGEYAITATYRENANYIVNVTDGVLTITKTYLIGDADGDGEITIFDATAIQRYLAGIEQGDFDIDAADADEDGEVSIFDATELQRFLAGMEANPNIGAYKAFEA